MVYDTFLKEVQQGLQSELGSCYILKLHHVSKINGIVLDGLSIRKEAESAAPTFYLNSYYELYNNGLPVSEIVHDLIALYNEHTECPVFDASDFTDFSLAKNKIMFRIIQTSANKELLEKVPHFDFLDLSIIFFISFPNSGHEHITAIIYNEHLKMWNCSPEKILELAKENTIRHFPFSIKKMSDVLHSLNPDNHPDDYDIPLYILSNTSNFNGAACMLYRDVLKNFADSVNDDLIILPSSIHEVLLIPFKHSLSADKLRETVASVNEADVAPEEQLSYQIYLYSKQNDNISIISSIQDKTMNL